jgi:hypothetical protein
MVRQFPDEPDPAPCDDALFDRDLTLERSAEAKVLYVSADVAAPVLGEETSSAAEGSWDAPFATIAAALSVALPGTTVLVAEGTYDEGIRIPAGVLVVGGLDPMAWEPTTRKSIVTNGVYFQADPAASVANGQEDLLGTFAGLVDFDVRRGVQRNPARASCCATTSRPSTPRRCHETVATEQVSKRWMPSCARRTTPSRMPWTPSPDQAFDSGFIQTGGCSPIARNRVLAFKTSFAANAFHFVPPAQGCVYAMYLRLDSNPKVRDNHFFLGWLNNRDIDEECVGCDPEELWGNVFHTHSADSILYLDRTSAELEPTSLDSMSEVEALNRPGMGWGR